ncbi:hypothetical protein PFY10_19925 [Chryseobacterium daecheongense]|nr:hypothetical protein PFY10_19925 [Chryseobacterium daecheongense]
MKDRSGSKINNIGKQHYMLQFKSNNSEIEISSDKIQLYSNEILMKGDLFTFQDVPELRKKLIANYGTDNFIIRNL